MRSCEGRDWERPKPSTKVRTTASTHWPNVRASHWVRRTSRQHPLEGILAKCNSKSTPNPHMPSPAAFARRLRPVRRNRPYRNFASYELRGTSLTPALSRRARRRGASVANWGHEPVVTSLPSSPSLLLRGEGSVVLPARAGRFMGRGQVTVATPGSLHGPPGPRSDAAGR